MDDNDDNSAQAHTAPSNTIESFDRPADRHLDTATDTHSASAAISWESQSRLPDATVSSVGRSSGRCRTSWGPSEIPPVWSFAHARERSPNSMMSESACKSEKQAVLVEVVMWMQQQTGQSASSCRASFQPQAPHASSYRSIHSFATTMSKDEVAASWLVEFLQFTSFHGSAATGH